ncbi:hypothetical protein ES708_29575 [subsurface metagenome]
MDGRPLCYTESMRTPSGKAEPATSVPLLDIEATSARKAKKRFRRMYHRVMSGLERQENVRLLTLTSSPESGNFQKHFRMLLMRLKRRGLVENYIRCPERTQTGLRHDHILFRGSYIEQAYLSYLWAQIHHSPVVDIRRVGGRHTVACYLANYLAKSPAARYSYSWGWVWKGFARSWAILKRASRDLGWSYNQLLINWRWCVRMNIKPEDKLGEIGYVFSYL